MKRFRTKATLHTLRTPLLLTPIIFILAFFFFHFTGLYLNWPSNDEQRTAAVYISAAISLLPILLYLLNIFSESKASIGFKAFGTDIKVDFGYSKAVIRQTEIPSNILVPGTYQSLIHSGSEEVIRAISRATRSPIVTINIKDGRAWWLSRLFALCAGAIRFGSPEIIVFLNTQEYSEKLFVGWAEIRPLFELMERSHPDFSDCHMVTSTIFNQLKLYPVQQNRDEIKPNIELSKDANNYMYTYTTGQEYSFVQILLDKLRTLEPPNNKPIWITKSFLSDSFGHCWHTDAIDLELPKETQIENVLEIETNYISLVQGKIFVGMIPSLVAIKMIIKAQ